METQEQLNILRPSQCDEFRGYLTSKPLPTRELEVLLAQATSTMMPSQRAS